MAPHVSPGGALAAMSLAQLQCNAGRYANQIWSQGSGAGLPDERGPEDCTAGEIQQKLEIVESSTLASVGESIALLF